MNQVIPDWLGNDSFHEARELATIPLDLDGRAFWAVGVLTAFDSYLSTKPIL